MTIDKERIDTTGKYVACMIGSAGTAAIGGLYFWMAGNTRRNYQSLVGESDLAAPVFDMLGVGYLVVVLTELVVVPLAQALSGGTTEHRTNTNDHQRTYVIKNATGERQQRVDPDVTRRLTAFADGRPTVFEAQTQAEVRCARG